MFRPINRRTFLRGAAGAMLPLPFLNAMEARAASPEKSTPPLRFVALFKPNGVHPPSWNIEGGSETDFKMAPMMAPFSRHRDELILLDNIGTQGFSSHTASSQRFLSGTYRTRLGNMDSASIDQLIADKIGGGTPHRSLELTTEGLFPSNPACSYISYDAQGQPIPRVSDPQLVFNRLFRDPLSNKQRRLEMTSLLDRVGDHAKSLARTVGREDRETLDQYLSVVRDTERRIGNFDSEGRQAPELSAFEQPLIPGDLNEQVEIMMDLIALALWTDSTRCVSYMLGNSNSRLVFDFIGVQQQHHYLSHFFRNFSRPNLDDLYKVCTWHMEKFDYLLERMKSYSDPDGRLLDHSVVLFGSGMGHSDSHTGQRIPAVLAGNAAGRMKTGRYLRYAENSEVSKLHRGLLDLFEVSAPEGHLVNSDSSLAGLDGGEFGAYREPPFKTLVEVVGKKVRAQGRLRLSNNLDEANLFFVDVDGQKPVRIQISFRNFQQFEMPFYCGTPVELIGNGGKQGSEFVINEVTSLKSLAGLKPRKG
jgi:hypothetical protein